MFPTAPLLYATSEIRARVRRREINLCVRASILSIATGYAAQDLGADVYVYMYT